MHIRPKQIRFFFIFILLLPIAIRAQQSVPPSLETILEGAAKQRNAYIEGFKNLTAQETKLFEIYGKNGNVKKKRSIISTFIVYPLTTDKRSVAEFRNVMSVDGKNVADSDKRAQQFFDEITKVESSKKELAKIEKEGARYDEEVSISGLTLFQAAALADNLRPFFHFTYKGTTTLSGREVYVVAYDQTNDSPYVSIDPKVTPDESKLAVIADLGLENGGKTKARLNGTFWLDSSSFQVRKEERILTVQAPEMSAPVVAVETFLEYQDSTFDILTPQRVIFTQFTIGKSGQLSRKDVTVVLEYSNFSRPDVEVKSADVKNQ